MPGKTPGGQRDADKADRDKTSDTEGHNMMINPGAGRDLARGRATRRSSARPRSDSARRKPAAASSPRRPGSADHRPESRPKGRLFSIPARSVPEVAHAGEEHRGAGPVRGRDHVRVALRAARLHERGDAGRGAHLQPVREREERVRGAHGRAQRGPVRPSPRRAGRCRRGSSGRPRRRPARRRGPARWRWTRRGARSARPGPGPAARRPSGPRRDGPPGCRVVRQHVRVRGEDAAARGAELHADAGQPGWTGPPAAAGSAWRPGPRARRRRTRARRRPPGTGW